MPPGHRMIAKHAYAGVFLVTDGDGRRVIGQLRDNVPGIDNPGRIGPFGGAVQPHETPRDAAWRELVEEETNLRLGPEKLRLYASDLAWRPLTGEWEHRHIFLAPLSPHELAALEVYEGRGWATIAQAQDPRLIDSYRPLIATLLENMSTARADGT